MPLEQKHRGQGLSDPSPLNSPSSRGRNVLLLIAINDYEHFTPLSNAVKDALDFKTILLEKYAFESDQLIELINEEASKDQIIETFSQLKKQLKPQDNLIVYYSGHGDLDRDIDESYWIPVDSRFGKSGDYFPLSRLVKHIQSISTHHTLLLIDACFAGAFLVNRRRGFNALEKDPSRYVIASGRKEFASDGQPGMNSPFAKALIEKLESNTSSLSVTELAQYVKDQTIKATKDTQRPIHNPLQIPEDKGGEFIFHLKGTNPLNSGTEQVNDLEGVRQKMQKKQTLWQFAKKYAWGLIIGLVALFALLSWVYDQYFPFPPEITSGTFIDVRDQQQYQTVQFDEGLIWMATNLNYVLDSSWCQGNTLDNCGRYGRLYSWNAAMSVCPDGWRLPSDQEWREMIKLFGGIFGDASLWNSGRKAYEALFSGGLSNFNAQSGGGRYEDGRYDQVGRGGFYWTATEEKDVLAWVYFFFGGVPGFDTDPNGNIMRISHSKGMAFSCRCVKEE